MKSRDIQQVGFIGRGNKDEESKMMAGFCSEQLG